MAESPGSPLSSHASSEFLEDVKLEPNYDTVQDHPDPTIPPAKRIKMGTSIPYSQAHQSEQYWDISSDSSGDVPNSPFTTSANTQDDDHAEQVTVCMWRNCYAGDLGNMDLLVAHIHDEHIGARQKRYACEWEKCPRIDANHASGYALRAHMRSHTREKPFYCALPECDKSFTRSDALAKHMRTVHETEALRPSDPVPRSHSQAQVKVQRLKLIVNAKPPQSEGNDDDIPEVENEVPNVDEPEKEADASAVSTYGYPSDVKFTEEELAESPYQLYRLLRRQIHWAEKEGEELKREAQNLQAQAKLAWQNKELVLANVIEADLATAYEYNPEDYQQVVRIKDALLPETMLPMRGQTPWYRILPGDAENAAASNE